MHHQIRTTKIISFGLDDWRLRSRLLLSRLEHCAGRFSAAASPLSCLQFDDSPEASRRVRAILLGYSGMALSPRVVGQGWSSLGSFSRVVSRPDSASYWCGGQFCRHLGGDSHRDRRESFALSSIHTLLGGSAIHWSGHPAHLVLYPGPEHLWIFLVATTFWSNLGLFLNSGRRREAGPRYYPARSPARAAPAGRCTPSMSSGRARGANIARFCNFVQSLSRQYRVQVG
jgi:hypothetical protein